MFRRKQTDLVTVVTETIDAPEQGDRVKGYTPSKRELGVVTPKRTTGAVRKPPPPTNRKEAAAQRRDERIKSREAMMRGDENALMPRDRGPVKRLARNVIDARRNASSYFFYAVLIIMVVSVVGASQPGIALLANLIFVFAILVVAVDSFFLIRRVRKAVSERLPNESMRGITFYTVMRAISFRKMRVPSPQVNIGDSY